MVELYVNNQKMDMFPDESINLIVRTKDRTDITKVFDDYSREFSVPASGRNNTILNRASDGNIVIEDATKDPRKKQPAELHINGIIFRRGYVKFKKSIYSNGTMKHHVLNFSSDALAISERLGDKTLQDLDLSAYNIFSDAANVYEGLQFSGTPLVGNIIFPLVYKDAFYSKTELASGTLEPSILPPALPIKNLFGPIKELTGLELAFHSTVDTQDFLYILAPREVDEVDFSRTGTQLDFLTKTGPAANRVNLTSNTIDLTGYASGLIFNFEFTVTPTIGTTPWEIRAYLGGREIKDNTISGVGTATATLSFAKNTAASNELTFKILSTSSDSFTISLSAENDLNGLINDMFDLTISATTIGSGPTFANRLPEIKLIDLVRGLTQLWNLVPLVDELDTNKIELITYDEWKALKGGIIDISRYIDRASYTIEVPEIPKSVDFRFKDSDIFFTEWFKQYSDNSPYNFLSTNKDASGDAFEITLPFTVTPFYTVDNNVDDYPSGKIFAVQYDEENPNVIDSTTPRLEDVYIFNRNSYQIDVGPTDINLVGFPAPITGFLNFAVNYGTLINYPTSFDGTVIDPGSYDRYYTNYMQSLLDTSTRNYQGEAILPLSVLSQVTSATIFKIGDRYFNINVIETDILTGRTKLDLLAYSRPITSVDAPIDQEAPTIGVLSVVPNAQPSQVTGLTYTAITPDSITLQWNPSTSSSTYVAAYEIYRGGTLAGTVTGNPAPTTITINGLTAGEQNLWRVAAQDAEGAFGNFSDPPLDVTQPLTLAPRFTEPVTQVGSSLSTIDISWEEAEIGVAPLWQYEVYVNDLLDGTVAASGGPYNYQIQGLDPYTNYKVEVVVYDTENYDDTSNDRYFATSDDVIPPSDVLNLVAVPGDKYVDLSWDAATDNVGVTNYRIYDENGTFIRTVGNVLSWRHENLQWNQTYGYKVKAVDARNNESVNFSNTEFATTVDNEPPSDVIVDDTTQITSTSAVLRWQKATDNVDVDGYNLYDNAEVLLETLGTGLSYMVTGLDFQTAYTYKIKARDRAGNLSNTFTPILFQTLKETKPPAVTQLAPSNVTYNSALISWTVNPPLAGQSGAFSYNIYANGSLVKQVFNAGTTSTTISLAPSTFYNIVVRAVSAEGVESDDSNTESFTTADSLPIPQNVVANQVGSGTEVLVDWDDIIDGRLTSYGVERKIGTGSWTEIADVGTSSYNDTSIGIVNATYRVYGKYTEGFSVYSNEAFVSMVGSPIADLVATASSTDISITWSAATDPANIQFYELQRSVTSASTGFSTISTYTSPGATDNNVLGNTEYWYRVRVKYLNGNYTDWSNVDSATVVTGLTGFDILPYPSNCASLGNTNIYYHDGTQPDPSIGDKIYTNATGTNVLAGGGQYFKYFGDVDSVIQVQSDGTVTAKTTC